VVVKKRKNQLSQTEKIKERQKEINIGNNQFKTIITTI
jgi:hypothetical protein